MNSFTNIFIQATELTRNQENQNTGKRAFQASSKKLSGKLHHRIRLRYKLSVHLNYGYFFMRTRIKTRDMHPYRAISTTSTSLLDRIKEQSWWKGCEKHMIRKTNPNRKYLKVDTPKVLLKTKLQLNKSHHRSKSVSWSGGGGGGRP